MRTVTNDCVGCADEHRCNCSACSLTRVEHFFCDECTEEAELYEYDGQELCESCLLKKFDKVEGSGW
jgi:hypothetical protein